PLLAADLGLRPVPHASRELGELLDQRIDRRQWHGDPGGLAAPREEERGAVRLAPDLGLGAVDREERRPVRVHPRASEIAEAAGRELEQDRGHVVDLHAAIICAAWSEWGVVISTPSTSRSARTASKLG